MSKLFKFVCVGLLSIFIVVPIYAKKGGGPSDLGKEHKTKAMKHFGKEYKDYKNKSDGFYDYGSKKFLPDSAIKGKFSDKNKEIITDFFADHPFKATGLPPGIAKNLARGKPLPPGIRKVFLPQDLSNLLGINPDYEYLVAGKDILLVNKSNQIVEDILSNILH